MQTQLTIDKAGRVVIPKPLRKELNLHPGDSLELDCVGDQITLRPVRETGPLVKEDGIWVIAEGPPMTTAQSNEILRLIREERELSNLSSAE
jgi:AbrB family looped-hinge helix DNA binding protein